MVVAGGGVAGLETIMATHAHAGSRVRATLIAPDQEFVYRPLSVGEPFGLGEAHTYPLAGIAEDFGVELVSDKVVSVDPAAKRVVLAGGGEVEYDVLVAALGARAYPAWDHVMTFHGPGDSARMAELVGEVERGEVDSAAFVVPRGVTWPLPLYELALMTAHRARKAGVEPELVIFTPESDPLAVFGKEASAEVVAALDAVGVKLARGVTVNVTGNNDVVVPSEDGALRFERVVAVPLLAGPALPGLPSDPRGFIPVDDHGRVDGVPDVFAAGDGTTSHVKQGGVAAQQADAVAEVVAQMAGVDIEPRPARPVLRAQLITGQGSRFLHGEPDQTEGRVSRASEEPLWWPAHKIAAVYLSPYLAAHDAVSGVESQADVLRAQRRGGVLKERLRPITEWIENNPYGE